MKGKVNPKILSLFIPLLPIRNSKAKKVPWYLSLQELRQIRLLSISFNILLNTITINYQSILNYFDNRSTNASAESFNAKIKAFRSQFRGVRNIDFFLFRLSNLFA